MRSGWQVTSSRHGSRLYRECGAGAVGRPVADSVGENSTCVARRLTRAALPGRPRERSLLLMTLGGVFALTGCASTSRTYTDLARVFRRGKATDFESIAMRAVDRPPTTLFRYLSVKDRIGTDNSFHAIPAFLTPIPAALSPRFETVSARHRRSSIPPERMLRTVLLQAAFTIESNRQPMEQLRSKLLPRCLAGLNPGDRSGCRQCSVSIAIA